MAVLWVTVEVLLIEMI